MIYFLLFCLIYLSLRTLIRWRTRNLLPDDSATRHRNTVSVQDGLQAQDERTPRLDPEADVLCQVDGSGGPISLLAFLATGRKIASACKDDNVVVVRLWDAEHGQEVDPPLILGVGINVVTISKDDKWIISGDSDGNVAIWNTSTHQKEGESQGKHDLKITALDVSPDSSCVASGSDDGTLIVWTIDSEHALCLQLGPLIHQDSESSPVSSVKFSPAGGRIASGYTRSGYFTIQIWHSSNGDRLASIPTDGQATRSLAWSVDGQRLFAGGSYGSIKCFDVASQKCLAKWEDSQSDVITSIYLSNADQFLVSASAAGRTIDIWDVRDISTCKHFHSYRHSDVLSAAISPNEHHLIHGGRDGKIYKRCLSDVIGASFFFHSLGPFLRPSEPLTYVSHAVYEAWKNGKMDEAEELLSNEITEPDSSHQCFVKYARANRSLVRARRRQWEGAWEDAEAAMSQDDRNLPIACIAKGIALLGQGKRDEAMNAFNDALCDCAGAAKDLIEHIKYIMSYEPQLHDELHGAVGSFDHFDDVKAPPLVRAQKLVHLAEYHIRHGSYAEALRLSSEVPDLIPFLHRPEAKILFLFFGWNLYDLNFMVHQLKSQALVASSCSKEAMEVLRMNGDTLDEEIEARNGILSLLSEKFADQAICQKKYDDAIAWYTVALGYPAEPGGVPGLVARCFATFEAVDELVAHEKDAATTLYLDLLSDHPRRMVRLLLKRSKARAEEKLWEGALNDANEVIRLDPICPWGYERREAAMPVKVHRKGIDRSNDLLSIVEKQVQEDISRLDHNHVLHPAPEVVIDAAIRRIINFCPLVLIDVQTGLLCDEAERKRIFKSDPAYTELVSLMASQPDVNHIVHVVARFFRYVMFSHTWEGQEPTFQDIARSPGRSVYNLDPSSRLNRKLAKFCLMVKDDPEGYRWAWSDTCCIDKTIEAVYKKSIRSMYNWYKWSSLTLVLLADVSKERSGELKFSRWMSRAWTLQELLAPKAIRFYSHDWKPYREDTTTNHKESPLIIRELANAVYVAPDTLTDFSPEALGVREKLRLASTRNATVEEDIAYSLIGIFNSDLVPEPRDASIALGLLLQEVVDRDQEPIVLDWTGEPSKFHSCLPASISVYARTPYSVPCIALDEMEKRTGELRNLGTIQQDAITFYGRLSRLEPLHFTNHRLYLPCIIFPITSAKNEADTRLETPNGGILYIANAAPLGEVRFKTTDALSSQEELVLVYPWIRDLLTQAHLPGDTDTLALRLIAYLEQPFRALLLAKHLVHNEYRRIAADSEVLVAKRKITSLKDIGVERLVVL